jgi:glutamyl-tRNA synthetase
VGTVEELADAAVYFYRALEPSEALRQEHYTAAIRPVLEQLRARLAATEWNRQHINEAVKAIVAEHKLKLPKVAMPLRVMVSGGTQTPSIDATLELIGRDAVLARMDRQLHAFPA